MEEELNCPVCLDYFKSPVRITPCGHNYCQACLTGMLAIPWLCPECRTEIQQRPEQLARNFFLERTVKNYVESRRNICGVHDLSKKLQIAAETEQMRRQVSDQKTQLEDRCDGLQHQLNKERENNEKLLEANQNLQASQQNLQFQLENGKVICQRLESEKISLIQKSDRLEENLIQANHELAKARQEKQNLQESLFQLQSSGSKRQIEELHSFSNDKLTEDLKAVTSYRPGADDEIRILEGSIQETQTRFDDSEQSEKIQEFEREWKEQSGLKTKKEPLQAVVETAQPASVIERKQTIVCESFSDNNYRVTVSNCKRSVKGIGHGYCFLKHQKIDRNHILQWSLRIPKCKYADIGMVIILE